MFKFDWNNQPYNNMELGLGLQLPNEMSDDAYLYVMLGPIIVYVGWMYD